MNNPSVLWDMNLMKKILLHLEHTSLAKRIGNVNIRKLSSLSRWNHYTIKFTTNLVPSGNHFTIHMYAKRNAH